MANRVLYVNDKYEAFESKESVIGDVAKFTIEVLPYLVTIFKEFNWFRRREIKVPTSLVKKGYESDGVYYLTMTYMADMIKMEYVSSNTKELLFGTIWGEDEKDGKKQLQAFLIEKGYIK